MAWITQAVELAGANQRAGLPRQMRENRAPRKSRGTYEEREFALQEVYQTRKIPLERLDQFSPLYREGLLGNPALCECSRGFAEEMFHYVIEKEVEATIVESVLRKGTHCVYKIEY